MTHAADMRKVINEDKRLTLLISLVHECRTSARDEVVTMFCKRFAALHKKGRERLDEIQAANRAETEWLIGVLAEVLASAPRGAAAAHPAVQRHGPWVRGSAPSVWTPRSSPNAAGARRDCWPMTCPGSARRRA